MIQLAAAMCLVSLGPVVIISQRQLPALNAPQTGDTLLTDIQLTEYGHLKQSLSGAASDAARESMLKGTTLDMNAYRLIIKLESDECALRAETERRQLAATNLRREWARSITPDALNIMRRAGDEHSPLLKAQSAELVALSNVESLRSRNAPAIVIAKAQLELDAAKQTTQDARRTYELASKEREHEVLRKSAEGRTAAMVRARETTQPDSSTHRMDVPPVIGDVAGLFDSPTRAANKRVVRRWLDRALVPKTPVQQSDDRAEPAVH